MFKTNLKDSVKLAFLNVSLVLDLANDRLLHKYDGSKQGDSTDNERCKEKLNLRLSLG